MLLKILLVVLLLISVIYLMFSLKHLVKDSDQDKSSFQRKLSIRFGFCLIAFVILMVAFYLGYIKPHPLG